MRENDFNHIKTWLRPQLKARRMTVERFANKIGVSRTAVYAYLSDLDRPRSEVMYKMCRVLGRPVEEGLRQYTPKPVGRRAGTGVRELSVRR